MSAHFNSGDDLRAPHRSSPRARLRIAFAGNPNAGKTTLFNRATGARAKVANYPGVTVERHEASATLASGVEVTCIDLPGCYSLVARSPEEEIAHQVLVGAVGGGKPDVVVAVVDAASLARGLYLALQLINLESQVIVALNMIDSAAKQGVKVDAATLSQRLGVPVVETIARSGRGTKALLATIESHIRQPISDIAKSHADSIIDRLPPADRRRINDATTLLSADNNSTAPGEILWAMTSDLAQVRPHFCDDITEALLRLRSEDEVEGSFGRKVINAYYSHIDRLIDGVSRRVAVQSSTERVDRVLLHPLWGTATLVATLLVLFQAVFAWAEPLMGAVETSMGWLATLVNSTVPEGLLRSALINGLVAGVGNVLVFLPQIGLLFLGLAVLEESGYLARAAVLLDGLMSRIGLHGKAFIPLMSCFACAIPGIMAARTIESRRDRLITILIAPLMSCSARLPVYVLVISAAFATTAPLWGVVSVGGLIMTVMYFLGFVAALLTAWLLKESVIKSPKLPLMIELPPYRMPLLRSVIRQMTTRCKIFVTQTGKIILGLSLILWVLMTFPRLPANDVAGDPRPPDAAAAISNTASRQLEHSIAGHMGHMLEPIIAPLGFDWRIGIGLIASFAAREVLVSTLGQVYAIGSDITADAPVLRDALLADRDPVTGKPRFSPLVGLSLMVFFVLAMQCMSTFATVRRETNSWRWPIAQLVYMNILAYVASLAVFQIGSALGLG